MTLHRRSLFGLLAIILAGAGVFAIAAPSSAATTKKPSYTYVYKCVKYKKTRIMVKGHWRWKTICAQKKRVRVSANSYKPRYNLMTSTGSSRKLPTGLVAVCGNGKNIFSPVTSTTCKGSAGIAWCAKPKLSKYCPQY